MSKKFKASASSSRAQPGASGGGALGGSDAFSRPSISFGAGFGAAPASQLSYVYEPPDLSSISDSSVVVALKNLQKRDSTTKGKALNELLVYTAKLEEEKGTLGDGLIEAWIRLYARTSIDNARQVRQRTHTLQGRLARLGGRRIAKSMTSLVGPWLCGLHDTDKLVMRSAQEAFYTTFSNEEKRLGVWKVYHGSILGYCNSAILNEDVKTLSDERMTNADDAEAKFSRTIGTAISTVIKALETLPPDELQKQAEQYKLLFDATKLWSFASYRDSYPRQGVYQLLIARLEKFAAALGSASLQHISAALLGKALRTDQTGSTVPFVKSLALLTRIHPDAWTSHYVGKKRTASQNLQYFFERLPAGAPPQFWTALQDLLEHIPAEIIAPQNNNAQHEGKSSPAPVLDSLHRGMSRREQFRAGSSTAWKTYLALARRICSVSTNQPNRDIIVSSFVLPLVRQFIIPHPDGTNWTIGDTQINQEEISLIAITIGANSALTKTTDFLQANSLSLIEQMQASLPERAQGFVESQRKVAAAFALWFKVKGLVLKQTACAALHEVLNSTTRREAQAAIQLLKARNGKPFGAAVVLRQLLENIPQEVLQGDLKDELVRFLQEQGPTFLEGPSSTHIMALFQEVDNADPDVKLYERALQKVVSQPASPARTEILTHFTNTNWPKDPRLSDLLNHTVREILEEIRRGDFGHAAQVEAALSNKTAPFDLIDDILAQITDNLSTDDGAVIAMKGLSVTSDLNQAALQHFLLTERGPSLAPKLLLLSKSASDETMKQQAGSLTNRIKILSSGGGDTQATINAIVVSIHQGLADLANPSLTVQVLVSLAQQVLESANTGTRTTLISSLLPSRKEWEEALEPYLSQVPDRSLAITNELGGAIYWIEENPAATSTDPGGENYDVDGQSLLVRLVRYTLAITSLPDIGEQISSDALALTCSEIGVFNQMASDHLSIPASVPLWGTKSEESDPVLVDFVAEARSFVRNSIIKDTIARKSVTELLQQTKGRDTRAYYRARAFVDLENELLESSLNPDVLPEDAIMTIVRKPSGTMYEAAMLATMCHTPYCSKLCNSLVADLVRHDFDTDPKRGLHLLVMLNLLIQQPEFDDSAFSQQHRVVLFVKHVTTSIKLNAGTQARDAEILRALSVLISLVNDIFDTFWEDMIQVLFKCFSSRSSSNATLHGGLRLFGKLRILAQIEETNDDLKEAWVAENRSLASSLLSLMEAQADLPDVHHQPRQIVNGLLARYLCGLTDIPDIDITSLYPVMASQSSALQKAAFKILHAKIPDMQERITLNAALTKDFNPRLPGELLSLVLEAPSEITDLRDLPVIPTPLLQYLYSWKLIFDHWIGASYQVQSDYVTSLKDDSHTAPLLDLIFEHTINSRPKPLDVTKLHIEVEIFDPDLEDTPDRDVTHLLCHLYLLALKHIPSLVRSWWRDSCPRALQRPVEEWTERYFSPLVIAAELAAVSAWAPKQEIDTPVEVKVLPRQREVTASFPIDEQETSMRVILPTTYPLATVAVEGINRVGVDERKWRAWLVNTQGIMNFASSSGGVGAVTDGLVAWRRNVTGTLKGQSECAICYSVVNADRQLPSKRCGTCKNSFHGTCLFRWFKSSGGSSCPLCRNAFNYG